MFMDFIYTVYTEQHGTHRNIFCADMPKARGDLFEVLHLTFRNHSGADMRLCFE